MKKRVAVKSVMTPFPYSVEAAAPVGEAQSFMLEHKIHHLPVTMDGELKGVITDRDIKLVLGPDFAYPDPQKLTVEQTMIKTPYAVDLNTPLDIVLEHMATERLGCALVLRNDKLAGVFTVTDACRAFAEWIRADTAPPEDDLVA